MTYTQPLNRTDRFCYILYIFYHILSSAFLAFISCYLLSLISYLCLSLFPDYSVIVFSRQCLYRPYLFRQHSHRQHPHRRIGEFYGIRDRYQSYYITRSVILYIAYQIVIYRVTYRVSCRVPGASSQGSLDFFFIGFYHDSSIVIYGEYPGE